MTLWQVRKLRTRAIFLGICGLLWNVHSKNLSAAFCDMVRAMPLYLKYSESFLFEPGDWKTRDRFLDLFIKELCKKYNIVHPSKR